MSFGSSTYHLLLFGPLLNIEAAVGSTIGSTTTYTALPNPTHAPQAGNPQRVPDRVFVSTVGTAGFLTGAVEYHQNYGFSVDRINSIEELITMLAAATTPLSCVRMVAHATRVASNTSTLTVIQIPFATGGSLHINSRLIEHFNISNEAFIRSFIHDNIAPLFNDHTSRILNQLRANNSAVLTPFGLQSVGNPTGLIERYFYTLSDGITAREHSFRVQGSAMNSTNRTKLGQVIDFLLDKLESQIIAGGSITAPNLTALRSAALGITYTDFGISPTTAITIPDQRINDAKLAIDLLNNNFRTTLNTVKIRFNSSSFVDLRGCRIGQDPTFLSSLATFFGTNPSTLPTVTAPNLWQMFDTPGQGVFNTVNQINNGYNSGAQGLSSSEIQTGFTTWNSLIGLDNQFAFWTLLLNNPLFYFATYDWANKIPNIGIRASKIIDFNTLDFSDMIDRLAEIFNITNRTNLITNAQVNQIEALQTSMLSLKTQIERIDSSPNATILASIYQELNTIDGALSQSIVPDTAPATITIAIVTDLANKLQRHIEDNVIHIIPSNLLTEEAAIQAMSSGSTGAAGDNSFTNLQSIQTAIGASGIVPATNPNTGALTKTQLQAWADQLRQHIIQNAPLQQFADAIRNELTGGDIAKFRYLFLIGAHFVVQKTGDHRYYIYNPNLQDGVKSAMLSQWETNPSIENFVLALQVNWQAGSNLSGTNIDGLRALQTPSVDNLPDFNAGIDPSLINPLCPFPEYHQRIIPS